MNISLKGNVRSCLASLLMLKFQFIIWEKKKKQKEQETKKINQKTSSWIIAVTISFKLTPGQTASNMYMRCLVLLAGFTKHVRCAHVYYEADFAPTHPRWLIIGSRVFDGLFDTRLPTSRNTLKIWSTNMFDRVSSPNILCSTGSLVSIHCSIYRSCLLYFRHTYRWKISNREIITPIAFTK